MKPYDRSKPLISIHVPKCGGASFSKVLRQWFGKNFYRHYYDERHNKMPKQYSLKKRWFNGKYKKSICIHGHFNNERNFGVKHYYPEVDQFIAVLRDPFEMHLSYYFYIKKLGLNAFKNGKIMWFAIDDSYTLSRYLSETDCYLLKYFPFEFTLDNYHEILSNHFIYLGVTEFLQVSVNNLAKKIGFSSINVGNSNVSEREEEVPDGAREMFKEKHKLEYAMYEYALCNYRK